MPTPNDKTASRSHDYDEGRDEAAPTDALAQDDPTRRSGGHDPGKQDAPRVRSASAAAAAAPEVEPRGLSAAQNQDCSFIKRGDYNDCAHAGGGRGASDEWCDSCKAIYKAADLRGPRLAPLTTTDVLWLAAIEFVPIGERVEWVAVMEKRVAELNEYRANYGGDPPGAGWSE